MWEGSFTSISLFKAWQSDKLPNMQLNYYHIITYFAITYALMVVIYKIKSDVLY